MGRRDTSALRSVHVVASVADRDGGATTAVLNTVRALNDIGTEALILATTADGNRGALDRPTDQPVLVRDAPVLFCRRSQPLLLKNSWQQAVRTVRQARRASVLHVHGVYLANSIWAFVAHRLTGTPYVLQPHGTLEPYQERQSRARKRVFNTLIGRRILERADALVATSQAEASNLRAAYPRARVVVVPLGTDALPATPPKGPLSRHAQDTPRDRTVVFLGRLATKKRVDLLLDAWNTVTADGHLLLAGHAEDWTWQELSARLSPERRTTVDYLGPLTATEVSWLLGRAGVLVHPSENENFGLVIAEAMAHGCAVITTVQTAASEHVTAADAGIVLGEPALEPLAEALERLLASARETGRMGSAAQNYAAQTLTWAASANRLRELYATQH